MFIQIFLDSDKPTKQYRYFCYSCFYSWFDLQDIFRGCIPSVTLKVTVLVLDMELDALKHILSDK